MELIEWNTDEYQLALTREFHAQRARDWWGMWNNGFAIARLLAHFPHPQSERGTYVTIFDTLQTLGITHMEEAKTCMFRFMLEFERIKSNPLMDGWFKLAMASAGSTYNHIGALPRIVFVPTTTLEEDGFIISEDEEIYRAAWNLFAEVDDFQNIPTELHEITWKEVFVTWLVNEYGPLYFPYTKKKFNQFQGRISISIGKSKVGAKYHLLHHSGKNQFRTVLQGTSDSNLIANLLNKSVEIEEIERFPKLPTTIIDNLKNIDFDRSPISDTWFSFLSCLSEVSCTRVHANMIYSLSAELLEGYNNVIPVIRKESTRKTAVYEFETEVEHPVWGPLKYPNAVDFADLAFEETEGLVAVNNAFDPLTWSRRSILQIAKDQNAEPHTLLLTKTLENSDIEFPKKGFLKISNHGNRSIADRKKLLVQRTACLQVIDERLEPYETEEFEWLNRHNILTKNLEFGKTWRLDSKGPMQLIQGPPGTGKTWTSTRLVEDILKINPSARILICSKEHLALDHLVDSLESSIEGGSIRLARIQSSSAQLKFRDTGSWEDKAQDYWEALTSIIGKTETSNLLMENGKSAKIWTYSAYLDECQILCTTTTDSFLLENLRREQPIVFDYSIVEEAGKSYISELLGAFAFSRNWILVGDQMQLPPYQIHQARSHYKAVIDRMHQDKAFSKTKDYISRELQNLSKALLWGKVNEEETDAYIELHMDHSFEPFKAFYGYLKPQAGTHFLPEQRRMFKELSGLIASVFYNTEFTWKKERVIKKSALPNLFQKHSRLIFINTPHSSREKRWKESLNQRHSRQNKAEAETIISLLEQLGNDHEIVILTPYKGQVDLIHSMLPQKFNHIEIHTTDGYQGKEADYILLSLVRNNILTGRSRWGFVTDPHRLNVALSRAREGLIVVSSKQHIEESELPEGGDHLQQALRYIEQHGKCIEFNEIGRD